jgi:hypothetical protein
VLAVDYNAKTPLSVTSASATRYEGGDEDSGVYYTDPFNDGINMLFLIRLVAADHVAVDHLGEARKPMLWCEFDKNEPVYDKFKKDLDNPFQFTTLKLND